ncbi:glutamate 5-kinase [Cyclobacterium lianum]|uniref:Glutamate 5-kinase n=1 Tax=Cyclobacterium lianum TaxID=388280 RepID=A0A1M7P976_9BACT|nr:glutamate 5-kinase [Cyclobacterium lianum]SHN13250.1 glutamate 5-kinase [Cyclobacterium lianum]
MPHAPRTLVIKIGSNVLTLADGSPDLMRMRTLVEQMVFLLENGIRVILVSSGAVAFGRKSLALSPKTDAISRKQVWAAIGQIDLIRAYKELFSDLGHPIAQLMVTREDFRDRTHYLNMKNCLEGLLKNNIVPVINENDAVAVTELMFTDNDELAGLVAAMVDADTLILLTNVDGIFKGQPSDPSSELIDHVGQKMPDLSQYISTHKSSFGRGGMLTKMTMAKKSADLGIEVLIANGKKDNVLIAYYDKTLRCTYFEPGKSKHNQKKWIAHSDNYSKGEIIINEGAKKALLSEKITSLLPIGIHSIKGEFLKGDIVRILDVNGKRIGLGKAEYGAATARDKIGVGGQRPLVHYDYLYISELN